MQEETVGLKGYVDPRTGQYVRTREDASPEEVAEVIGFIQGWMFYWNGPIEQFPDGQRPIYSREDWLASDERMAWFDALTDEQRKMLEDSYPPEEVPQLEKSS